MRKNYDVEEITSLEKLKEAIKIDIIEGFRCYWEDEMGPIRYGDDLKWMDNDSSTWTQAQWVKWYFHAFWRNLMAKDINIDVLFQYYANNTRGDYWELERDANRWRMLVDAIKEENIVRDILEVTDDE